MSSSRSKVLVAMSGGVDSSVAAALLQREGHDVVGCFMRLGSPGESLDELLSLDEACEASPAGPNNTGPNKGPIKSPIKIGHQGCCSITDAADARQVAAQLGIPLYVCNFKKDFGRIIDYFVDEYAEGRTPNPCVRCNDWLKFGKLHDYALQIGADLVASGHYARTGPTRRTPLSLLRGVDTAKDQSYVLFGVPRERLPRLRFPIGELPKAQVRDLARSFGLPVFDKPDSQEICFVPDNDYAGLVERRAPGLAAEGPIVDAEGRELGRHGGQHRFTIGQRRGLSLSLGYPVFVVSKNAATNTVVVGPREGLIVEACDAGEANWLIDPPTEPIEVLAKFRSNSPATHAIATALPYAGPDATPVTPSGRTGRFTVRFTEPQQAVARGQAIVLYDAGEPDAVLGGGWIDSVG